jgi:hypothetical protein
MTVLIFVENVRHPVSKQAPCLVHPIVDAAHKRVDPNLHSGPAHGQRIHLSLLFEVGSVRRGVTYCSIC